MPKAKKKSARQLTLDHMAALIEHIDGKFEAVMEMVQPIPKMQGNLRTLQEQYSGMKDTLDAVVEIVKPIPHIQSKLEDIDRKLDATMEEVANLRVDMEIVKQTVTKHDQKIQTLS